MTSYLSKHTERQVEEEKQKRLTFVGALKSMALNCVVGNTIYQSLPMQKIPRLKR